VTPSCTQCRLARAPHACLLFLIIFICKNARHPWNRGATPGNAWLSACATVSSSEVRGWRGGSCATGRAGSSTSSIRCGRLPSLSCSSTEASCGFGEWPDKKGGKEQTSASFRSRLEHA